jgi:hypothetical protein
LSVESDTLSKLKIIKDEIEKNSRFSSEESKKQFWKIVGEIKRDPSPDDDLVNLSVEIRDVVYLSRLGPVKPIGMSLLLFTICGFGFIVSTILFSYPDLYYISLYFALIIFSLFMLTYVWVINIGWRGSAIIFLMFVGGTIIYELFADIYSITILKDLNRYMALASVPSFYLYGRIIGGYIGNIKFDGVSRDVFYLPTLKINYKSYLLAEAPARQWIFFFGGIGTVITSILASIVVFIFYNDPLLFLFPVFLFFGEILDYIGVAGFLSGGEFSHLKREHKIIKDWKKNKEDMKS